MSERIHYIDSTRALASILGIFFHASLVFSNPWLVHVDPAAWSESMREFFRVFTFFRMPLFLIVSGFFTAYGLNKYAAAAFARHRARRIVLPFLSALIIFIPLERCFSLWSHGASIREHLPAYLNPVASEFSLSHLWFLYYIMVFSVVCFIEWHVYRKYRIAAGNEKPCSATESILILCLIFVGEQVLTAAAAVFTRNWSVESAWLPFMDMARLFPIFYVGYLCFHRRGLLEKIHSFGPYLLIVGIVAYYPLNVLAEAGDSWYLSTVVHSTLTWTLTLGVFYLIKCTLNFSNPTISYLSQASYGVYLFHHPVIVAVAAILIHFFTLRNAWLSYLVLICLSLPLTYALYHLIVKKTRFGAWLFTGLPMK